jgi:hypothetical protein
MVLNIFYKYIKYKIDNFFLLLFIIYYLLFIIYYLLIYYFTLTYEQGQMLIVRFHFHIYY